MIRHNLVKRGVIRPCQPTPLVKIGDRWCVGVPTYDVNGVLQSYATAE